MFLRKETLWSVFRCLCSVLNSKKGVLQDELIGRTRITDGGSEMSW